MFIESDEKMNELSSVQEGITVTNDILSGGYMCDCTGCESECFEICSDGNGPTN